MEPTRGKAGSRPSGGRRSFGHQDTEGKGDGEAGALWGTEAEVPQSYSLWEGDCLHLW